MKPICLIADSVHESIFEMLSEIDWDYKYLPDISRDEIKSSLTGFDGLIIRSKTIVDQDLLGDSPTIRFVGRAGAGVDNIDESFLVSKNIKVLHAAEGNRDAVGEHAMAILLSLLRHVHTADQEVRNGLWKREENRGEELSGKTVGIIGYGNMGQSFAKRLSGFECKVLVYDKYKRGFEDKYCKETTLDELFEQVEILSLHVPLTRETRMMVSKSFLNRFRRKIILLNTSRGEIVSMCDVSEMLQQGRLRGVAFDVLENENLRVLTHEQQSAFNYLSKQSNVILTPHIAGWTVESHVKINVALIKKIKDLIPSGKS